MLRSPIKLRWKTKRAGPIPTLRIRWQSGYAPGLESWGTHGSIPALISPYDWPRFGGVFLCHRLEHNRFRFNVFFQSVKRFKTKKFSNGSSAFESPIGHCLVLLMLYVVRFASDTNQIQFGHDN